MPADARADQSPRRGADPRPVVLVGFMGAGKTTVGRLLAARLGGLFADSDEVLTARVGRTPQQIFAAEGEAAFRSLERSVVADLVRPGGSEEPRRSAESPGPTGAPRTPTPKEAPGLAVVALGGGAVEDPATRAVLREALVVYLDVSHGQALARVGGDPGRPMLARADLDELHRRRNTAYREVADVVVATDGLAPAAVVDLVAAALAALGT